MKVPFSIVGITLVAIWGYKNFGEEQDKMELRKSSSVIEAKIVELDCPGKNNKIIFKIDDRTFNERIYLSAAECSELSDKETIYVKIDSKGNVIFAKDDYNDSSEIELISTVLISLFLIGMMIYYGIIPEIRNIVENIRRGQKGTS
jgi:hypothetical protein